MTRYTAGIGASAGGLEALTDLLGAVPAGTDMAFIVVQHLEPSHESLLAEILAKKTAVPVSIARAGEVVKSGHVYVIPADAILTVRDDRVDLTRRRGAAERRAPVDMLFKSLAVSYGDHAIGVVLSGGDSDGSLGIREIKHAGGFTFAQQPESARFPNMPQHAVDTGSVDFVLRPHEIADELVRLSRWSPARNSTADLDRSAGDSGTEGEAAQLKQIFHRLHAAHGVDFTHYKRTSIKRRLERRMTLRRIERLDEYISLIDEDPAELDALHQDFLIRVTEFFREPDSFGALRRCVFPTLCEGRSANQPIRIWVPGCATGEEAYSITIALLEYLGDRAAATGIQVFGTDVSEAALQKARAGVYHMNVLHHVSAERLQRFFTKQNSEYRIAKEIRDLCLFARQDVTRDPPFSKLDLISCRNLLIYLDDVAQRRVLRTFHFALRPQGMLFFGPAESVSQSTGLFEQADKQFRVFRRMPNSGGGSIGERGAVSGSHALDSETNDTSSGGAEDSMLRDADRLLLARFAPACLLVNQALTVLQFRGDTGRYLRPIGGPPSFDLRRIIRPELLVPVLPAIRETGETGRPSHLAVQLDDGVEVSIEIISLTGSTGARSFLILFGDDSRAAIGGSVAAAATSALLDSEKDRRIAELQREVDGLRDYVRTAIEEHGAVEEELRSAHEEMLSTNEEFRSANEELETSKEELQSTNEELTTTIDELRSRSQELSALNAELDSTRVASDRARVYADTIIETVREPLAVLDREQRILRANPAFSENLEVPRDEVEGRFFYDIDHGRWNIPALRQRLNALLTNGEPLEDWEVTVDLPRHGRRVLSLSARRIPGDADRSELFLLAFEDVTAHANMTADLLQSSARKDQFIAMLGHELRHPLTPIMHAIYLLRQRNNLDSTTVELLSTIDRQAQQLLRFVNELLDVARIGRGLIEIQPQRLDLVALTRDTMHTLQPFIEGRRQVLSLVLPAAPIYVNGDSGRLNQVITNLVENAVKFTDPGGEITVTVKTRDNKKAVLHVRDSGVGIAAENLERIFEPFTPAHELAGGSGLGLGLSVVRRILELHGGHIEATSGGLAKGSEFVATLPLAAPTQADDSEPKSLERAPAPPVTAHARKVLIVDDHEEVGQSIARLIRSWGYDKVEIARDGRSALALADSFRPDCAIVDISLPGMNGIELARHLRKTFPAEALQLIALTGYAGADMREGCLAAGFDAHLVKPGEIALLQKLLGGDGAG